MVYDVERRDRKERYFRNTLSEDVPREWMTSLLDMLDVVLDYPGVLTLQDVVDMLDYGPKQFSPRERAMCLKVKDSWDRFKMEQDERCRLGNHRFRDGRCLYCKETKLKVVDD